LITVKHIEAVGEILIMKTGEIFLTLYHHYCPENSSEAFDRPVTA
jgi:hypothetical protein